MGELSKRIGEEGEAIVLSFFKSIGWSNPIEGININCLAPKQHRESESASHGVDLIYSYACPVLPNFRRNVLVSVKNSKDDETRTARTQVTNDLQDLATAVQCFKRSKIRAQLLNAGGPGPTHAEDLGLLFKMNKAKDAEKSFLGELSARSRLDIPGSDTLCFFENARHDFIAHSLAHRLLVFPEWEPTFLHPRNTLTSQANVRVTSSTLLPIHSLIGGPLCLRLERSSASGQKESALLIYSQEPFSTARFQRLVGAAMELSSNWVDVFMAFPQYVEVRDKTTVRAVLSGLSDSSFANKVKCISRELLPREG